MVKAQLKVIEDPGDSRVTLLKHEKQYFLVHQAIDREKNLSLTVRFVNFAQG